MRRAGMGKNRSIFFIFLAMSFLSRNHTGIHPLFLPLSTLWGLTDPVLRVDR
jgi:hypothetical protein